MACSCDDANDITLVERQVSVPNQQGYDFEFIPQLDSKYECPICLLCQREPTQTTCGHRFCKDCILAWIRTESHRCPVDNCPITEHEVFPDNFARREILCLSVRCPNYKKGCQDIMQISEMDEHQQTCSYRQIPCPNGCPILLIQQEVADHVAKECLHRIIECSLCYAKFPLNQQEAHFETCPMVSLPCMYCQANLPRQEQAIHIQQDCPKVPLRCPFADVGCDHQSFRNCIQDHLSSNLQNHLRLLGSAHGRLQNFVSSLAIMMDGTSLIGSSPSRRSFRNSLRSETSQHDHNLNSLVSYEQSEKASPSSPSTPGAAVPLPADRSLVTSAEALMRELFQRNIQLEQRSREQEIKMSTLLDRLANCETSLALMKERLSESEGRFTNGTYLWRIDQFPRLVQEAQNVGHSRLLHSPGFYTSAYGYKVCLRLNVLVKEMITWLSLFIHFMQGEYDDTLDWPFVGTIQLSLLDQSDSKDKRHITETMVTKPILAAFQRPISDRNPKGFGYTEFTTVDTMLKSGAYVLNDTILIKAAVNITQKGTT